MKKKIYLSFPMAGRDVEEYTKTAREDQAFLEAEGFEVVSPLDNGLPADAPVSQHMRADYKMLLDCDAIYLCKGWEYSHGCMNELQVAADCRIPVITIDDYLEATAAVEDYLARKVKRYDYEPPHRPTLLPRLRRLPRLRGLLPHVWLPRETIC